MSKGGVYKITGNKNPKVGVKTFYNVVDWYPETPHSQRDQSLVTWELFVKGDNGYRSTGIKKKGVNYFTFGPNAYKFSYKVEGYLHETEGKEPMAIFVQPQKNENSSSAEKEILGVELTYQDGSKITKTLHYLDKLRATAKCQNLALHSIVFKLWEDDEENNGHNSKNQFIAKSPPRVVDSKGNVRWDFTLFNTYIALANKREDEKKKHEYYVTAEYVGKYKTSGNVNVNNPENGKTNIPSKPKNDTHHPLPTKTPQPKPTSPKASTKPSSKNNQADVKGYVKSIKIRDKNRNAFTTNPKFGENVMIIIDAKDVKGLDYNLRVWESDYLGKHDILYNEIHTFKNDLQYVLCTLTNQMRIDGELGNDKKNPDSGEYKTGYYQEIFAEIVFMHASSKSSNINVDLNAEQIKLVKGLSTTSVDKKPEERKDGGCKCYCNTEISGEKLKEMVVAMRKATNDDAGENFYKWNKDNLFTGGHEKFTDKSYDKFAEVLKATFKNYDINSCIRKIHFLAQCYHETGAFTKSVEGNAKSQFWYDPYRGRGFIHLTLRGNYEKFQKESTFGVLKDPTLVSTDIEIAAKSSGWYWKYNDMGDINPFADMDSIFDTSRLVNKPNATKSSSINGYNQRVNALNALKPIFKFPQECCNFGKKEKTKENKLCPSNSEDCICTTAFIVENGFIKNKKVAIEHISVIEHGNFKDDKNSIQKIILHRTAGSTTQACKNAFKNGRKNKKGIIQYFGTHFIVGKDGIITQTADLSKVTWHCAGWNSKSVGIEVVGAAIDKNGKPTLGLKGQNPVVGWEAVSDLQAKSVACLVKGLLNYYSLDKTKIDCHEHLAAKEKGEGQIVFNAIKDYL